ncbi:hypothetical protein KIH87_15745 [Paraneptunicella aestuarii]|uniref:hypothetical protein n=1 Tax=Paraneptunicella aestuarii TaxID=2831148 RepID=UPI001E43D3BA|nr:hypothetical protein [Paraneptunicella aestuarii]UAA38125.1 hypothetical protein KIH87_15745 [Paraneptunicella aestuarii]
MKMMKLWVTVFLTAITFANTTYATENDANSPPVLKTENLEKLDGWWNSLSLSKIILTGESSLTGPGVSGDP